jgi:hypothetical protein
LSDCSVAPHTTVSPTTVDSLHDLLVVAESSLLRPLDTVLVVATVSSSSPAIVEFICSMSKSSSRVHGSEPSAATIALQVALTLDFLIDYDAIIISSNLLTAWAVSTAYSKPAYYAIKNVYSTSY